MDSKHRSILVMDANQRSALAATRALGKYYNNASITTADETPDALAGASKYSSSYIQYPSPSTEPEHFLTWVRNSCLNGQFDLIVPTTEITSQLLLMNSSKLPTLPLAFAEYDKVMTLANKALLVKAAITAGVKVPQSQFYESANELKTEDISYPAVLKPNLSKIYANDGWVSTTVRILKTPEDLERALSVDTYLKNSPFMIQEFIPGHGAGLFCLYNKGKASHFFAHNRLREKPPEGGVSVLSQAAELNPTLKESAVKLLDSVQWHGVAMVEFRIDEQGNAYLMEVNTRFWGSLQLAIDSGVNFPVLLAQQFFNEPTNPKTAFSTKQRLRWLMGDIDSLYIYLKRPYSISEKVGRVFQFLSPKLKNQKHEINRLDDIKPFFYELKHYFK